MKEPSFFVKLKIFYNHKRIVIKQYNVLYNLLRSNSYNFFSKYFGGVKFIKVLAQLEMRFSVVILRLFFAKNIKQAEVLIKEKKIFINNTYKHFKYITKPRDLLRKVSFLDHKNFFALYFKKKSDIFDKYLSTNNNRRYFNRSRLKFIKPRGRRCKVQLVKYKLKKIKKHKRYFGKLLYNV